MSSSAASLKKLKPPKFVLISGGDNNGVDNGRISASIGLLFKANGCNVSFVKIDPCYDSSCENLNPSIYGGRHVLEDGDLVSMDIAFFEMLFDQTFSGDNFITKGKVIKSIKRRQRESVNSKILADKIVEETINLIHKIFKQPLIGTKIIPNLCIIVIGDIFADKEFQQALTELKENYENSFMHIHLSKLLGGKFCHFFEKYIQQLRDQDFKPDMIIFQSNEPVDDEFKKSSIEYKLLKADIGDIINLPEVENIKEIPIKLQEQNVYDLMAAKLQLERGPNFEATLKEWRDTVERENGYKDIIKIVIVGKYFIDPNDAKGFMKEKIEESYEIMVQQLKIAAAHIHSKLEIFFAWGQDFEGDDENEMKAQAMKLLKQAHGILVPAGLKRIGFDGIIKACKYARENKIPCLSICFGMQAAAIEFALNKLQIIDEWPYDKILHQCLDKNGDDEKFDARKGKHRIDWLTESSKVYECYGKSPIIYERNCNRDEIKPDIIPQLFYQGLRFVAVSCDENGQLKNIARNHDKTEQSYKECIEKLCQVSMATQEPLRMQVMEIEHHPFYVGIQYHAKSGRRPSQPSPPFVGFLIAARRHQNP